MSDDVVMAKINKTSLDFIEWVFRNCLRSPMVARVQQNNEEKCVTLTYDPGLFCIGERVNNHDHQN